MTPFKLFVCIVTIIISTWAAIPCADVQLDIFVSRPADFEESVSQSMNTSKERIHKDPNVNSTLDRLSKVPKIDKIQKNVMEMRDMMAENSQWRMLFAKVIVDETEFEIAKREISRMRATMETVGTKMLSLERSNDHKTNRATIASILHFNLDVLINFFSLDSSLFRKFPLLAVTPMRHLAKLTVLFTPKALQDINYEAMNPQISCKMRDLLLDYLPRVTYARLHQIDSIFQEMADVMAMPSTKQDANQTNCEVIDCTYGCTGSRDETCLKDKLCGEKCNVTISGSKCVQNYMRTVKQRVDELFPIDQLDKQCAKTKLQDPTGNFQNTIKSLSKHLLSFIN